MREHDEGTTEGTTGETDASTEGVALSPYDSDLDAPATEAEPEPYRLDDSPEYAVVRAGRRVAVRANSRSVRDIP